MKRMMKTATLQGEEQAQPRLSVEGAGARYVGRVTLELWERPGRADEYNLTMMVEPSSVGGGDLLVRCANALPRRVERMSMR